MRGGGLPLDISAKTSDISSLLRIRVDSITVRRLCAGYLIGGEGGPKISASSRGV